ncbi:MAG TPA: hypothetical protein DEO65_03345 [Bacillus bacterium]|nr:hypothetical protein [Bacillus sp. (in: firmicutes)]
MEKSVKGIIWIKSLPTFVNLVLSCDWSRYVNFSLVLFRIKTISDRINLCKNQYLPAGKESAIFKMN